MRKVVDSNYLQGPKLRDYLSMSKSNIALLTDYAAMEAYKGDTLTSIYKSMSVLAEYPNQVVILKNTVVACGLNGNGVELQSHLIDISQTRQFGSYCNSLAAAKSGNIKLQLQLLEFGKDATQHLEERMLVDAQTMSRAFDEIANTYTKDELRSICSGDWFSGEEMIKKLMKNVLGTASEMFKNHPNVERLPKQEDLPDSFIFRAALCANLLALDWISVGGAHGAKLSKIRNDMVDVNFATFATYYDGLLSNDSKAQRIHILARRLLSAAFGCNISNNEDVSS